MNAVVAIATAPAVLALVNLLKGLGLSGRWSALVAVLLGVAITAGGAYLPSDVWQTIAEGLVLGLAAAGLYDVASRDTYTPERAEAELDSTI